MKRLSGFVLVLLITAPLVQAGDSVFVVALGPRQVPVAAKLDIEATSVAVPLNVECDERDALKRAAKLSSAAKRIIEQVNATQGLQVRAGAVSFSPEEAASPFLSKSYVPSSNSSLFVMTSLGEKEDIYVAGRRLIEFIGSILKAECISIRAGAVGLAVEQPEQYRPQLLKLIAEQASASKAGLGAAREIEVGGLEGPVVVVQKNARQVSLFLPYTIRLKL